MMTAKEYLQQVGRLDEKIRQLEREIEALRATESSLRSPWPDGLPRGTGIGDPVGREAARVADKIRGLEERVMRKRGELFAKRLEVIETLGEMKDPTLNRLLWAKYVDGQTWEQIAVDLSYTYRHIINLHGKALEAMEEILERRTL